MPFTLSSTGTISIENADLTRAIATVEKLLVQAKAARVKNSGGRIEFKTSLRVFSWNFLSAISSGTLSFRQTDAGVEVHYRLSHLELLVTFILSIVTPPMFILICGWNHARISVVVLALWPFIIGLMYHTSPRRFSAALKEAIENAAPADPREGRTPQPSP